MSKAQNKHIALSTNKKNKFISSGLNRARQKDPQSLAAAECAAQKS